MKFLVPTTGAVVGYNQRTSDSSQFGNSPKLVALTTTASVYENRIYQILVTGEIQHNNAGGAATPATIQSEIRITTDGSNVSDSSTQIGRGLVYNADGIPVPAVISTFYTPSSDHTLKVGVVSFRAVPGSTGANIQCQWTADTDRPMTLAIIDCGPDLPTAP